MVYEYAEYRVLSVYCFYSVECLYFNISKLKNIIDMNYEERRGVNLLSARRSAPSTLVTTVEVVAGMLDPFASVQVPRLFGMELNNRRITTTVAALWLLR